MHSADYYSTPSLLPWLDTPRLPLLYAGRVFGLRAISPSASCFFELWLYQTVDRGSSRWAWSISDQTGALLLSSCKFYRSLNRCETVLVQKLRTLTPWLLFDTIKPRILILPRPMVPVVAAD